MKRTDLAYIAGIIDGEGSIYSGHRKGRYQIWLSIQMTDRVALEFVQSLFGGKILLMRQKGNRRDIYRWRLTGYQIHPILTSLSPYLLTKLPQAKIALRILESHTPWKHYTPMEQFLQEADALAIRTLNKRGKEFTGA